MESKKGEHFFLCVNKSSWHIPIKLPEDIPNDYLTYGEWGRILRNYGLMYDKHSKAFRNQEKNDNFQQKTMCFSVASDSKKKLNPDFTLLLKCRLSPLRPQFLR